MEPTIGRIVHFKVASSDAISINGLGGNHVHEGDVLPAVLVRTWDSASWNLKVICDGPADYWATSRLNGDAPGQWQWPTITKG